MADNEQSSNREALRADRLERYKVRTGLVQAIVVTLITGGVAVAIPAAVDAYRAGLELEKATRELDIKRLEVRNSYTSSFLSQSINQDIEIRLRLAEYFSFVADESAAPGWQKFYQQLDDRRRDIRSRITTAEEAVLRLNANEKLSLDEQVSLSELDRELSWYYAEVGYVRTDTSVSAPRTPANDEGTVSKSTRFDEIASEYRAMFAIVSSASPEAKAQADRIADTILANRKRYGDAVAGTDTPWFLLAALHWMESGFNFERHPHNGDPLNERTVHPPKGRPESGEPPYSWEDSARDFVSFVKLGITDAGDIAEILYALERYNGFGYRRRGVPTPFLWGCTNHQKPGAFVADGLFDPLFERKQCGAAAILKALADRGVVNFGSPR